MKKLFTLGFSCFVMLFSQAQIFNRSLELSSSEDSPVLTHKNGTLYYANTKWVRAFDANGNATQSSALPDSLPAAITLHTGFLHQSNGKLLLYGHYIEGCDVLLDEGFYLYELDNQWNWSRAKTQSVSLSGVHDLIEMDNNRLFMLTGNGYVLLNATTYDTIKTASVLSGLDIRQAIYLGGDEVLVDGRTWASAQPRQLTLDVSTNSIAYSGLSGGYHFDVSDTLVGVYKPAFNRVVRYNRFTQTATDSININLSATIGVFDVLATQNHLLLKSSQNLHAYSFPNMDSAGAYEPHNTSAWFIAKEEQVSTSINGEIAVIGPYLSHIGLESGSFGIPHASIAGPLSMHVENISTSILSIDTNGFHLTGTRGVRLEADWEVTLYNNSTEVLDSFRLMHTLPIDMFCGPRFGKTADTVYTLMPGDSVKVQVYKVPSGDIRFNGTDVTNFYEVHAVMANGKQVDALTATGSVTIQNVSVEEFDLSDLAIFPNPAQDVVRIDSDLPWQQIDLINLEGKVVRTFSQANTSSNSIQLQGLRAGIYLVKIQTEKGNAVKRLIIQ
jgi:hypothetical protein